MNEKIAIDVVLFPSDEMTARAIELNKTLSQPATDRIILDPQNCLPHISLVMGCIEPQLLPRIEPILQDIAQTQLPSRLSAVEIHIGTNSKGQKTSLLGIAPTQKLQSLHETITEKLQPFLTYDVTPPMLLAEEVSDSTLSWIKNFPADSSYDRFYPHITIGYGELRDIELPIEFNIARLAVCHLGNHCTCKKILLQIKSQQIT